MNKLITTFIFAIAACGFVLSSISVKADPQQMQQLVPDVVRPRKTDRTYVFPRAQFIYPLGSDRYLHRWVDRPLFVDPNLSIGKSADDLMTQADYQKMQQTVMDYGLDGFAFFPQNNASLHYGALEDIYKYTDRSAMKGFQLLPVFDPLGTKPADVNIIKSALANPASFRIHGKIVVVSYRAANLSAWEKRVVEIKQQFGDHFIFLAAINFFDDPKAPQDSHDMLYKFHHNTVTPEDIERCKNYLREWLRVTDGVIFNYVTRLQRRSNLAHFDASFYRDFVIRIMKSVLVEPEFNDKYFALSAIVGHENSTRVGRELSSDGTQTLRDSFEAAMDAQPDFITIPEWDEQNENTSLRPTVYNGLSSMRIMRYYAAKIKGQTPTPLTGDNTSVPDLILSYRKVLTLGEKLEFELLNVPDTDKSTFYTARLILEDANKKTVYASPVYHFDKSKMQAQTLTIPSETLSDYALLTPRIETEIDGKKSTFADGLGYMELRSTWNWDYKWAKQPLRDLLQPKKVDFQVSAPQNDGTRLVSATFDANEPLAYVEVLDDNNVVYSQAPADDAKHFNWHENADQVIIGLNWQSFPTVNLQGGISLKNAEGRWSVLNNVNVPTPLLPLPFQGQMLSLDNTTSNQALKYAMLSIKRSEVKSAKLEINLPGIYQGIIPVQELLNKTIYGISGPKGFNLVLSHYLSQSSMPQNLNVDNVHFSNVPILPDLKESILQLQAIGKSGHIYRSEPILFQTPTSAKKDITVFSGTEDHAVSVSVPADRVPDIRYQFNPDHGSALLADAGRPFWGILGGYFAQVTGRGGGNYGDDSAFVYRKNDFPAYDVNAPIADAIKTAPDWIQLSDGEYALQFNGKSTFITLPQGVIPPRAAFTIEMDIKPEISAGQQVIIGNRNYSPGSITVYSDQGILKADAQMEGYRMFTGVDSGLSLPEGKWSHLTISYDQNNLQFAVDGKMSKVMPMKGPGQRTTASVVGGFGDRWFNGQIKSLEIQQGIAKLSGK